MVWDDTLSVVSFWPCRTPALATMLAPRTMDAAAISLGASIATRASVRQDQTQTADSVSSQTTTESPSTREEWDEFARSGEEITGKLCAGQCHPLANIFVFRRTARDWERVVREMADRGVVGTKQQLAFVGKYLMWSFGVVAVNSAPADELSAVLGLSATDSEAIVAYREANGALPDMAALSNVPGIDKAWLEELAYAVRFD